MKNWFDNILPRYARLPLLCVVAMQILVYFGTRFVHPYQTPHDLSVSLDGKIPYVSFFILFYILAYVQWVVGYLVIARTGKETLYKAVSADLIAKAICLVFYLALPSTMERADISAGGFFNFLTGVIYTLDTATNLFPSIHCLESWAVFRMSLGTKLPRAYKIFMGVFSVGVFLSVVFVKQHVLVDIPAGILAFEIGFFITHFTGLHKKLIAKFSKEKDALPLPETQT